MAKTPDPHVEKVLLGNTGRDYERVGEVGDAFRFHMRSGMVEITLWSNCLEVLSYCGDSPEIPIAVVPRDSNRVDLRVIQALPPERRKRTKRT